MQLLQQRIETATAELVREGEALSARSRNVD
jgi:hypothetical protein